MIDKPTDSKKEHKKETKKPEVVLSKPAFYYAVGRRKVATAQVKLFVTTNEPQLTLNDKTYEKGTILVNDRKIEEYFPGEVHKKKYLEPLRTTNTISRFVIIIKVTGGGLEGQLVAVIHALARALTKVDEFKFRPILKKRGFLTRDPRAKQRRKAGFSGKARKKKQSPKR
jgi:small subunit ribosomal protein S9